MSSKQLNPGAEPSFVTLDGIRRQVRRYREPQFMVPARFTGASFASFEVSPDHPEHARIIASVEDLVSAAKRPQRRWRRRHEDGPRGIYLLGPPGVGKTHLLAAAYQEAAEPKIFASFDELAAAAGTLGTRELAGLLAKQRLVCIDEITLDDPGNIMLLTSLVIRMLEGEPRIVASANIHPEEASNHPNSMSSFERELGQIAASFQIVPLQGRDRRPDLSRLRQRATTRGPDALALSCNWAGLIALLDDTHPMHDAGWLEQIDLVEITDQMTPFEDQDRALRFVRFIDRVYDRDVAFSVRQTAPSPDSLLAPLSGDRRFSWHLARCRSRLSELLSMPSEQQGVDAGRQAGMLDHAADGDL